MSLTLGSIRFSATWGLSLLTLVLLSGLIGLGLWQLDRAEEKQQLIQDYTDASEVVSGLPAVPERFRGVRVTGYWDRDHIFLLDNMVHQGRTGYYVLAPLVLEVGQSPLLVNLGWTPSPPTRDQLPSLAPLSENRVQIQGRLNRLPQPGIRLDDPDVPKEATWPRVVVFPTIQGLSTQLDKELYPLVLMADSDEASDYVREWELFKFGPERHYGYAFQWFALALALFIIYIVVNSKRVKRE